MKIKRFYKSVAAASLLLALTACGKEKQNIQESTQMSTTISEESTEQTSDMNTSDTNTISKSKEELQQIAEDYLQLLAAKSFDKLSSDFAYDTKMQELIDDGSLMVSMEQTITALGALNGQQASQITEKESYIIVSIPCDFEAQDINLNIVFTEDGKITGINVGAYSNPEEETVPEGVVEEEVALEIGEGMKLPGTLTRPEEQGEYPIVILVHGSGPNDRDETVGPNKPFRDIAWELAQQGIASYRYDKRTMIYPENFVGNKDITVYEETVADAVTAIAMVKELENINADKIYVLGHSLGGGMIPRIAENSQEQAAGYIFFAAPNRKLTDMMKEQYEFLFSLIENPNEEQKETIEKTYAELERFKDLESADDDTTVFGAYVGYWKDLDEYEPLALAEEINVPCLVLQGEEDYQVTMEDFKNWKDKFEEKENWTFHSYPGLTHLFMKGEMKNGGAEYSVKQNVDEQVIQDIIDFIKR